MTAHPYPVPAGAPSAGVSATAGSSPPASPLLAEAWLLAWGRIGGHVTIGADGNLHPWFEPGGCTDRDCATVLLTELVDTPGLPVAVKIVLATGVRSKRRLTKRRRAA